MKKIGLIGGVGWPSTIDYYRIINEEANKRFGNLASPPVIIYSVNFQPLIKLQYSNQWLKSAQILGQAARALEKAGADMILICSATTNIAAGMTQKYVKIPIINIAEVTAKEIQRHRLKKVLLLGTKATMEHRFFRSELAKFAIHCVVPSKTDREIIHQVIYDELCFNKVKPASKRKYLKIIDKFINQGIEGVILGCTEIPMLISPKDLDIPTFDITKIHALEGLKQAMYNV